MALAERGRFCVDPFVKGQRIGRFGLFVVAGLFLVALVWLSLAPLSSAAIVDAQLKVESYRRPVQHLEGGWSTRSW